MTNIDFLKIDHQKVSSDRNKCEVLPRYYEYILYLSDGGMRNFKARNNNEAILFLRDIMEINHKPNLEKFWKSGFIRLVRKDNKEETVIFPPPHKTNIR